MASANQFVFSIDSPYNNDTNDPTTSWKNFKEFEYNKIFTACCEVRNVPTNGPLTGIQNGGQGFFVSKDGYVVTAAHVIVNDTSDSSLGYADVYVKVTDVNGVVGDCRTIQATVIGIDGRGDIAVLKVPGLTTQHYLTWGKSRNLSVMEAVYAVGAPGFDHSSTSVVFVRDPKHWEALNIGSAETVSVTTGTHGNSGGPLLNSNNNVVGIMSFIGATTDYISLDPNSFTTVYSAHYATKSQIRCGPAGLPAIYSPGGLLIGPANNLPLIIDGHTFTGADVFTKGVIVKDQDDPRQNGSYGLLQVENAGQPWILFRALLTNANAPFLPKETGVYILLGTDNHDTFWLTSQNYTRVDPLYDGTISSDVINFFPFIANTSIQNINEFGYMAFYAAQNFAQPVVEKIIACDRNPLLPPVIDVDKFYIKKGWLGVVPQAWSSRKLAQASFSGPALSSPIGGFILDKVIEGYGTAPIDLAFANLFTVPPGLFTSIVNNFGIDEPWVVRKINNIAIGCLDRESPISDIIYNNPPGSTVNLLIEDVYGNFVVGPFTLSVVLGLTPRPLDSTTTQNTNNATEKPLDNRLKIIKALATNFIDMLPEQEGEEVPVIDISRDTLLAARDAAALNFRNTANFSKIR